VIDVVRVERDEDLEAWLDIRNRVRADDPVTREEVLHRRAAVSQSLETLARLDGVPAGFGVLVPRLDRPRSSHVTVTFGVLPELRRRGVGAAIDVALSTHAKGLGFSAFEVEVRESEDDGVAYLRARGFEEVTRYENVELQLAGLDPPELDAPPGVEVVSRAERPDLVEAVYAVAAAVIPTIPGSEPSEIDFESWRAHDVERPGALPELSFAALADGEVIGYASLLVRPHGDGIHLMTAVLPEWRGRGVGGALKRAQIRAGCAHGLGRLVTINEERNLAIRRLNERLGYRPLPALLVLRGPLALPNA